MWVLGDLPVSAKLSGTIGHVGKHPCKFCLLEGTYVSSNNR